VVDIEDAADIGDVVEVENENSVECEVGEREPEDGLVDLEIFPELSAVG